VGISPSAVPFAPGAPSGQSATDWVKPAGGGVFLAGLGPTAGACGAAAVGVFAASGIVSSSRAGARRRRFVPESIPHGCDVCETAPGSICNSSSMDNQSISVRNPLKQIWLKGNPSPADRLNTQQRVRILKVQKQTAVSQRLALPRDFGLPIEVPAGLHYSTSFANCSSCSITASPRRFRKVEICPSHGLSSVSRFSSSGPC